MLYSFRYKNQFLLSFLCVVFDHSFSVTSPFYLLFLMIFFSLVCLHVLVWVSVWLFCVCICGFTLYWRHLRFRNIFTLFIKNRFFPLFPAFACIHFFQLILTLFNSVLLREVNPTDETDPFIFVVLFVVCVVYFLQVLLLFIENAFFPGGNKPFNWLIFCLFCSLGLKIHCFDWCV